MICTTGYISADKKIKIILAKPMEHFDAIKVLADMLGKNINLPANEIYNSISGEVRQMPVPSDYKYEVQLLSEFDGYL